MTSIFPSLLAYQDVAPFIIRIVSGITLAYFGYEKMMDRGQSSGSNSWTYGAVEVLLSMFLIIGLYTQLAALINVLIILIKTSFKATEKKLLTDGINYYILLLAMTVSLLFTGAGILSIDSFIH